RRPPNRSSAVADGAPVQRVRANSVGSFRRAFAQSCAAAASATRKRAATGISKRCMAFLLFDHSVHYQVVPGRPGHPTTRQGPSGRPLALPPGLPHDLPPRGVLVQPSAPCLGRTALPRTLAGPLGSPAPTPFAPSCFLHDSTLS